MALTKKQLAMLDSCPVLKSMKSELVAVLGGEESGSGNSEGSGSGNTGGSGNGTSSSPSSSDTETPKNP